MPQTSYWQKSTFSDGGDGNTCVELAATSPTTLRLRESETPHTQLTTTHAPLTHLIRELKSARSHNT
ncbi:DUF397 domain-containing protein [Streptomyces sp. NPDC051554]|uniref:DUF397 domain-containing protein n=1 Tax=Streptomyces sp. NPDC051554 TaxID=3365656 RepID=UPI003787D58C